MADRRQFLTQTAAVSVAGASSVRFAVARTAEQKSATPEVTAAEPAQTWKQYLEESAVSKEVIDQFLRGPSWAQFDPELGYVLSNSLQADGVDHSSTFSTIQSDGARTSFMYTSKAPRINTYGDSFTQCHQVSDGETWQQYLAAHLGEPIANFGVGGVGVYQAYRRMIREEKSDHGAKYVIFYIWGDDHIRSLYRARWGAIYPWFSRELRKVQGVGFHANFWANVEMDLDTGQFVEKAQLLPTRDSLYHMTDPHWMEQHLRDDLALQLTAYSAGLTHDLDRDRITQLGLRLGFPFDWSVDAKAKQVSSPYRGGSAMTRMQAQVAALLDRYALRASRFILDKVRAFASQNGKQLLVVLFDPFRAMEEMRQHGTRYDQEIVEYLQKEKVDYFDMNEVHLRDFSKYALSWEDYLKQYFIGHYNPAGNHLFAYSIKEKIVPLLDPKPVPYQNPDQQTVSFKGYIKGYR